MANLRERIELDIDNIGRVFNELPPAGKLLQLSILELAGVATLFYYFIMELKILSNNYYTKKIYCFQKPVPGIKIY